jgi:hypothetical protein
VSAPEGVEVDALGLNPVRLRRGVTEIVIGDLTSEQRLTVVVRLTFPYGQLGDSTGVVVRLLDRDDVIEARSARLTWEYAGDPANDRQPRDAEVDRAVGLVFAARARQEALARNRAGDYAGAQRAVSGVARRIRTYAGTDQVLREVVASLEADESTVGRMVAPQARQAAYASAAYQLQSRSPEGKARKKPTSGRGVTPG